MSRCATSIVPSPCVAMWAEARCTLFAFAVVVGVACAPTLSKPRGAEHLAALAEAERHQHHGRLDAAAAAYGRAAISAERRVDRDEALYRESRVRARQGDYARAVALCDRIAEAKPKSRRTERAILDGARYRLELGQVQRAEHDLRGLAVGASDSGAASSALRLLLVLHVRDAPHAAGLGFVRALGAEVREGKVAEVLMHEEAELLIALGRKAEARAVLTQQVARFPYPQGALWDDALYRLADLDEDEGDPRAAITHLDQMLAKGESAVLVGSYTRPKFPDAALRIARLYRDRVRDLDAAVRAFRAVRERFPDSRVVDDALAEEAELWLDRGDPVRGCTLLRQLLAAHEVGAARRRAAARLASDCPPS